MGEIREFDVIVLGAGPAGEVCAGRLADGGLSVALVERELVGGECSFYACMPSKALLRPAQVLAEARRVPGAAQAGAGELDIDAVLHRRDEVVHHLEDSEQLPWLRERSIALVRGEGRITAECEVSVGEDRLRASRAIIIATGSRAAIPAIAGLQEAGPWTNREATTSSRIPRSLVILGGGVVGVEMAQAYAALGAEVSLVEARERLIAGEEEFASELLREAMERLGVSLALGVKAVAVARAEGEAPGPVTVELEDGRRVSGEEVLVAVGRRASTDGLGLEALGLQAGGSIEVQETMQVGSHPWLYVVGDANGRALLTHMGKYQARIAADHILGREALPAADHIRGAEAPLALDGPLSPRVIFTEPQVAAVGHTLASARRAGLEVRCFEAALQSTAGASFIGHGAPGRARILVEPDARVILGATFVGVEVAESLHAATIAIVGEVPLERLWHAVACFPTRSEVWLKLLEAAGL